MNRDVRLGLGCLLALACLIGGLAVHHRTRGTRFWLSFEDAGGLRPGDPVYLQGVDIGEVLDVDLVPERKVRSEIRLEDRYAAMVPDDSTFLVANDKLLFGKKAVLVVASDTGHPPVQAGQIYRGTDGYVEYMVKKGTTHAGRLLDRIRGFLDLGGAERSRATAGRDDAPPAGATHDDRR